MSLLAAPRRRQIILVNPQGKSYNDSWQKFGKKLMGKTGWQDGDGLGPNRDGPRKSLAMKFKDDNRGLGCSIQHEQNWLAHGDDFNAFLTSLNKEYSGKKGSVASAEEATSSKIDSLEEKSKNAKGRIHYQKFARGKDLSSKSSMDISSIFGGKMPLSKELKSVETEEIPAPVVETRVTGLNTIESKDNMHDYFSKKMALRKNQSPQKSETDLEPVEMPTDDNADLDILISKKSKKKKKRQTQKTEKTEEAPIESEILPDAIEEPVVVEPPKKKKKKRHVDDIAATSQQANFEETFGEVAVEPEKKKKKKRENDMEETAALNQQPNVDVTIEEVTETTVEKVRRKKSRKVDETVRELQDGDIVVTEETKKEPLVTKPADAKGESTTTKTTSVSFNRTNFSLNMRGIRAQLGKLSDAEKQQMFPGSNVFDIAGYGDQHFF